MSVNVHMNFDQCLKNGFPMPSSLFTRTLAYSDFANRAFAPPSHHVHTRLSRAHRGRVVNPQYNICSRLHSRRSHRLRAILPRRAIRRKPLNPQTLRLKLHLPAKQQSHGHFHNPLSTLNSLQNGPDPHLRGHRRLRLVQHVDLDLRRETVRRRHTDQT